MASAGATLISSIAFETPGTIVRSRGRITIQPQVYSADLNIVGAFGIGLVSSEAAAVGITAIPEPFSDADWGGWMVWQSFALHYEFHDATGSFLESEAIEIDSKAMRKVEPNSVMVFVAESQGGAFFIAETVRLLQMLH